MTTSKSVESRVSRLVLLSIIVAFGVTGLKFVAWQLTGSVALFSDALESIVNVVAAFAAWMAIRLSHKPADDNHPFGHHKAEYLSAVIEGVLIVVAALLIVQQSVSAILSPPAIEQPTFGLAINAAAAVINGFWAWMLFRTGREVRSPALIADAYHIRSDVITSVGVILGLLLAVATGYWILDPLLAIIVALNILWQGFGLVNSSVQGLMDAAFSDADLAETRAVIEANATGSLEYHDLKTREAGRARFIEFHLVVPGAMSVRSAHDICDRIEAALRASLPGSRIVIHIEPEEKAKHG